MLARHPNTQMARTLPGQVMMIAGSLVIALAFGCAEESDPDGEAGVVVATVDNKKITQGELDARVRSELVEIDAARYDVLRTGLDQLIDEVLIAQEAKARGMDEEALIKLEVQDRVDALNETDPIGPEEVDRFYDQYEEQLGGQPLDSIRPAIEQHLKARRLEARRAEFMDELMEKAEVVRKLRPPRVGVSAVGPSRGPQDAAVTIIEFSDFECPFCKNASATVERVMEQYEGKVRLVFRHFPLPIHDNAQRAAAAAVCAHEDGKFWTYHDLLFRNQNALTKEDLVNYAREAGIDEAKFVSCLESERSRSVVEKDTADAESVGVNGTPSFFINGRPLSGAQPFEAFKEAIDNELDWQAQGS